MTTISVRIKPILLGALDTHKVEVSAALTNDDPATSKTLTAPRIDADGKDRQMTTCLEEAFADILRQVTGDKDV